MKWILIAALAVAAVSARPKAPKEDDLTLSSMDSREIKEVDRVSGRFGPLPENEEDSAAPIPGDNSDDPLKNMLREEENRLIKETESHFTTKAPPQKPKKKHHKKHHPTTTTTEAPSSDEEEASLEENGEADEEPKQKNAEDFVDLAGPMPELGDFENQLNMKEMSFSESKAKEKNEKN